METIKLYSLSIPSFQLQYWAFKCKT